MSKKQNSQTKQIIVIGGGFGGLNFAKTFSSKYAKVTLIDKNNHHLFQPLLYQVATFSLSAQEVAQPLRSLLYNKQNIEVLMETANSIDLDNKCVITENRQISYDYLVIAAGRQTSYFGNDHWAEHTTGLKSLEDAKHIRNNVLLALEKVENYSGDETMLRKLKTIVIVGAGPTGVEMAGTLAELTRRSLPRDYRKIDPANVRVILLEADERVLPPYPKALSKKALRQLEELGVEVKLGHMVKDIRHEQVELDSGEVIEAANIIWTAGLSANALVESLDLPKDKTGCLQVENDCSLPGYPDAYAIGDIIKLEDANSRAVPGVAQGAIQTGKYVARQIENKLEGKPPREPFRYKNRGEMATIGRNRAVANLGKLKFSGFFAWLLWLFIHLFTLVGLRNRIVVFFSWLSAYLFERPGARVIWGLDQSKEKK